jgi:hypothetical protein
MNEEKIEQIIKQLIESTKSGALVWKPRDSFLNSESRHHFHSFSIDNQTEFQLEISLNENLIGIRYHNYLVIKNKLLVDGQKIILSNIITKELENVVYDKFLKPNIIVKQQDSIFDNILNSISDKQYMRDHKLRQLLDTKEEPNKI